MRIPAYRAIDQAHSKFYPVRPELVEGYKTIHVSAGSIRTVSYFIRAVIYPVVCFALLLDTQSQAGPW